MPRKYKRTYKRKRKPQSVAGKALKIATTLAKIAMPELKFFDTFSLGESTLNQLAEETSSGEPSSGSTVTNRSLIADYDQYDDLSGLSTHQHVIYCVNDIAPGTGETNRIGRETTMVALQSRITFALSTGYGIMRVAVIRDKQPNKGRPAMGDIYDSASTVNKPSVISLRNLDNSKRFTVLSDRTFPMDAQHLRKVNHEVYLDLKNAKSIFEDEDAEVPESGNSYYIVIFTNHSSGQPVVQINHRLRFRG